MQNDPYGYQARLRERRDVERRRLAKEARSAQKAASLREVMPLAARAAVVALVTLGAVYGVGVSGVGAMLSHVHRPHAHGDYQP